MEIFLKDLILRCLSEYEQFYTNKFTNFKFMILYIN